MKDWKRELDVAMEASLKAVELALTLQPGIVADLKSDGSPVTAADRQCELMLAAMLQKAFRYGRI